MRLPSLSLPMKPIGPYSIFVDHLPDFEAECLDGHTLELSQHVFERRQEQGRVCF